jgi:hypothetical protein
MCFFMSDPIEQNFEVCVVSSPMGVAHINYIANATMITNSAARVAFQYICSN